MSSRYKPRTMMLMLVALALSSGCATKDIPVVEGYTPTVNISGLQRDDSEAPTIIYRRPGAPELGEFNRFILDPLEIYYNDPNMEELSLEQIDRVQDYLLNAMTKELTDAGYDVTTKSGPGTLRISFALSGLRAPSAMPNVTAVVVPIAARVGEVTIESVFQNSMTNQVEAVSITRARGARWFNPSPWSTWADVEKFCDGWAQGFREAVDAAHAR